MCNIYKLVFTVLFMTFLGLSQAKTIRPADYQTEDYIPLLKNKRVAVVANATAVINGKHLVDLLLENQIQIKKIFALEHGFRGDGDAGEIIEDGKDVKTGLPVVSLYGNHKRPTKEDLNNVDIVLFDVQDVGVRYFTFISSLYYLMEECARYGKKLIVLDRPNPNGDYVSGPMLQKKQESFVGIYPIPLVHGLTVGELALMATGEGWYKTAKKSRLQVIEMKNYTHQDLVFSPIRPSPNLPTPLSIRMYASLGLFEPTVMSIGRGTQTPFSIIGAPDKKYYENHQFTPVSIPGMSKNPKHKNQKCYGVSFQTTDLKAVKFSYRHLVKFYQKSGLGKEFFPTKRGKGFFNLLTGNPKVQDMLYRGASAEKLSGIDARARRAYMKLREKYKLYPL